MKIVAEIGINHNGSVEIAKNLILVAKAAGCDYIKFQTRNIDLVYSKEELDKPRESPWGDTNRAQKQGLEFSLKQYKEIDKFCKTQKIVWFSSPWDIESVKLLSNFELPYLKIASASLTDRPLLRDMKAINIPLILSTGMSTRDEITKAVDYLGDNCEYLLACCSSYPCKPEETKINMIKALKNCFQNHKIGYSNHSPGLTFCIAAAALGAEMLELHITLDRSMYGSDQSSSIEPHGLMRLVKHVRDIEKSMCDSFNNFWVVHESEQNVKKKLRKL